MEQNGSMHLSRLFTRIAVKGQKMVWLVRLAYKHTTEFYKAWETGNMAHHPSFK